MSALIWLGIVAVWGFVLIPMWLRHHDNTLEQRSAERFTTAMRVLSRRGAQRSTERSAVDGTGALDGGRPAAGTGAAGGPDGLTDTPPIPARAAASDARPRPGPRSGPRTAPEAARAALVRARRQRLLVLLGAVPASLLVAVIVGGMWFVVQVIVDAGLIGYVGYLRHAAKTDTRLRASRAARDRQIALDRAARASAWRSGANPALLSRPPSEPGRSAAERGVHYSSMSSGSTVTARARDRRGVPSVDARDGVGSDDHGPGEHYEHEDRHEEDDRYEQDDRYAADVTNDETIDLSDAIATANQASGDDHDVEYGTGYDADPDRVIEATAVRAGGFDEEYDGSEVAAYDEDGLDPAGERMVDGDGSEVAEESGATEPYRGSPGRSGGRSGRPTTSKPGRVQVNPPGTHGGRKPPPGSEVAPPAASAERPRGDEGDDLDELLNRHAAGA